MIGYDIKTIDVVLLTETTIASNEATLKTVFQMGPSWLRDTRLVFYTVQEYMQINIEPAAKVHKHSFLAIATKLPCFL